VGITVSGDNAVLACHVKGEPKMSNHKWAGVCALMLFWTVADAVAFDESKYPNFKGQWRRIEPGDPVRFDPSKPAGRGQQAPLTPEYQAIFEAGLADLDAGGPGIDPAYTCLPHGMPRLMSVYNTMEIIPTPETTYILIGHVQERRRIYTDGRSWPERIDPTFAGYSIGQWIDTDGDGRYDALEVETRGLKGPRALETTGLPLHRDNETVVKEQIYFDKGDPNILHDEITTFDHDGCWSAFRRHGQFLVLGLFTRNPLNDYRFRFSLRRRNALPAKALIP
jgi:hypothetical protein